MILLWSYISCHPKNKAAEKRPVIIVWGKIKVLTNEWIGIHLARPP